MIYLHTLGRAACRHSAHAEHIAPAGKFLVIPRLWWGIQRQFRECAVASAGSGVCADAIAVFVHADNPVRNLSRKQLKQIFTGRVTTWHEVGGRAASISPTTEILVGERATIEMFREIVMDGAAYGDFRQVDLSRDQLIQLAHNQNGICAASVGLVASLPPHVRKKIRAISVNGVEPTERNVRSGVYAISRPLLLVTKGNPKGGHKDFIDFMLSPAGQRIVARNFVPVSKQR